MALFHTFALPIATAIAIAIGVKNGAPAWKHYALALGCGLMLGGLWQHNAYSIPLLVAGGVVFFLGVTRTAAKTS